MMYLTIQQRYIDSVGGNAHESAIRFIGRLEHALRQYANADNWGYYDESGASKGMGRYEDACFIGPDVARHALSDDT